MIHLPFPPLFAAGIEEIVGSLVGLLFLLMWIINQIREAKQQMARPRGKQQPAAGQAAPPAPVRAQAPAPPQGGQQADPLRDQVEEFLRRARRQQQQPIQPPAAQQAARRPRTDEIEVLLTDEPATSGGRPLAEPFRPINQPGPAQPAPISRKSGSRSRKSVAEHVAEHISVGARSLSQQTSQLGQRIITEDQQFDVQLKSKFDHAVGTLAASRLAEETISTPDKSETPASQIAAMLARPEGVRQAMVINEILRRPSDRW